MPKLYMMRATIWFDVLKQVTMRATMCTELCLSTFEPTLCIDHCRRCPDKPNCIDVIDFPKRRCTDS